MKKRIVVGLSGGVDSSVSALLLKKKGYDLIGLFMRNWLDDGNLEGEKCPWMEDSRDAMLVAEKLKIPFQIIDLSESYYKRIVNYMFLEYGLGRTPNPDILCNREIKFDLFLKKSLLLGADYVATGHYVKKDVFYTKEKEKIYRLLKGKDPNKDQSYFLSQLDQYQLSKAIFPLGDLNKEQVRRIALEAGLVTAKKRDSQGLCFIGKVHLPDFLKQKLRAKQGDVIEISKNSILYTKKEDVKTSKEGNLDQLVEKIFYHRKDGKVIGQHQGAHYYTKGQRKGLGIGGYEKSLFILDTDTKENIIYVGMGRSHPGLYRKGLFIKEKDIHWVREDKSLLVGQKKQMEVRIRYRQSLERACLYREKQGLYILFEHPQWAISEGQFAVWYDKDELIGSGVIS